MPSLEDTEVALKSLMRGLMSGSEKVTLAAYRKLYEAGVLVVPLLERELKRIDLQRPSRRETNAVVAGLASLLHDLDEPASRAFIKRSLQCECNPVIASTLRSIQRYSHSNYREDMFSRVRIFEEKTIDEAYEATRRVKEWLIGVPAHDIEGLSRIYIVRSMPHLDFAGQYLPKIGVVTLVWRTLFSPGNPISWLLHRHYKHVLYHEIGHHVHKHWFGQDPEQEEEADSYADNALSLTQPMWWRHVRKLVRLRR